MYKNKVRTYNKHSCTVRSTVGFGNIVRKDFVQLTKPPFKVTLSVLDPSEQVDDD